MNGKISLKILYKKRKLNIYKIYTLIIKKQKNIKFNKKNKNLINNN